MSLKTFLYVIVLFLGLVVVDLSTLTFGGDSLQRTEIQCTVVPNFASPQFVVTCPAPFDKGQTRTFLSMNAARTGEIPCMYSRRVGTSFSGYFKQNEPVFDCSKALQMKS